MKVGGEKTGNFIPPWGRLAGEVYKYGILNRDTEKVLNSVKQLCDLSPRLKLHRRSADSSGLSVRQRTAAITPQK